MEFEKEELKKAILVLSSTISRCEKMQLKFAEGSSQHTLLKNRIKALCISKALIEDRLENKATINYSQEELREALAPVTSIINKTTKAQSKYEMGSNSYKRFEDLIKTMWISKKLIEEQIN